MSKTWTNSTKCCATCANWAGPRQVSGHGAYCETESPGVRGKCYAGISGDATAGPTAMAGGTSCPKYQKWAALR